MPFAVGSIGALVAVGAAAAGAGASMYAANKASKAQTHAVDSANQLAEDQYDQTRSDQQPYRDTGYAALARMSDLLGLSGNTSAEGYGSLNKPITAADVTNDPGYAFGLSEGIKARDNAAAARGGLYSGAQLKAITQYGNDYATTKFDDAFNRDQQAKTAEYNQLAGVAGTGQKASNTVDAQGESMAVNNGANLIGAGNARGANDLVAGNALTSGINQGAAWWLRSAGSGGGSYGATPYGAGGLTSQAGTASSYLPADDLAWSTYNGG